MDQNGVVLDAALLCNMRVGRQFKDFEKVLRGMDFSRDGNFLVVYDEDRILIYNVLEAKL